MTELIQMQLGAMGLMVCGGMAAGLVYDLFSDMTHFLLKTDTPGSPARQRVRVILSGLLETVGFLLIGWCSSIFLYYSSGGKLTLPGILSFFAGLWVWKKQVYMKEGDKSYGEERKSSAGIREESPGAGHHCRAERTAAEKKQPKAAGRKKSRAGSGGNRN